MRLYALVFIAVTMAAPALAQNVPQFAATSSTAKDNTRTNSVAKSIADSLPKGATEMPLTSGIGTGEILDADKDGIPDSQDKDIAVPNPFAPQEMIKKVTSDDEDEDKPRKKQIYKGTPVIEMRRPIQDPRIDDGYVQGLIQQRAPH